VNEPFEIRTPRLRIRSWRDDDFEPVTAMNLDPRVMEFFPNVISREESLVRFARVRARIAERGYGYWPVEVVGGAPFAGMVGLGHPDFEAPFQPTVEIGWRLAVAHWGRGYATEAARAVLAYGFERLALPEIVSFTTAANVRSRRVMEKLGMRRSPDDDFLHPELPESHPLRPHVLYRLARADFQPANG
jgi:RimJ/RimL family protein N-acetyltransferase